jgi:predicted Rdx family selenoprotein
MPKFIIEREIPGASNLTEAELRESALKSLEILRQIGPEIQWIQSYVTDDKVYCVFFAPDDSLIFEHARRGGFPADRVSAVRRLVDPANYQ